MPVVLNDLRRVIRQHLIWIDAIKGNNGHVGLMHKRQVLQMQPQKVVGAMKAKIDANART